MSLSRPNHALIIANALLRLTVVVRIDGQSQSLGAIDKLFTKEMFFVDIRYMLGTIYAVILRFTRRTILLTSEQWQDIPVGPAQIT